MSRITNKMLSEYFGVPLRTVEGWKKGRPGVYAAMRYAYDRLDDDLEITEMTPEQLCKHIDNIVDDLNCTASQIEAAKDKLCEIVETQNQHKN